LQFIMDARVKPAHDRALHLRRRRWPWVPAFAGTNGWSWWLTDEGLPGISNVHRVT
jgi:hypothetical protein